MARILEFLGLGKEKNSAEKDVTGEFVNLYRKLYGISKKLVDAENLIVNWENLISNKETGENKPSSVEEGKRQGMMDAHSNKWIALGRALLLYRILSANVQRFMAEKQGYVDEIMPLDAELAKRIEALEVSPNAELEFLKTIAGMLDNNPSEGVSYLSTPMHTQEILQKLEEFRDKKTAYELRRLIILVTGSEINELIKCENDTNRWSDYLSKYRWNVYSMIMVIFQRLELYLKGSQNTTDDISREIYLGLASHFKDAELAKQMMQVPEIRNIWTCQQQLTFFNDIRYYVIEALKQPLEFYRRGKYEFRVNSDNSVNYRLAGSRDRWKYATPFNVKYIRARSNEFQKIEAPDDSEEWSLFLGTEKRNYKDGFVKNLRAGKKYIETVRDKFGNIIFANFLDETEQQYHESPEDWYKKLMEFEPDFINSLSKNIEPAKQALIAIFNSRRRELEASRSSSVRQLQGLLNNRIKELENSKLTIQKKFADILRKKRKKLLAELEKEKIEFNAVQRDLILAMPEFISKILEIRKNAGTEQEFVFASRLVDYLSRCKRFELAYSGVLSRGETAFLNDDAVRSLGKMIFAEHTSFSSAYRLATMDKKDEASYRKNSEILRDLLKAMNKDVLPNIQKVKKHIESRLIHFKPEVLNVIKSDDFKIQNEEPKKAA